MEDIRQKYVNAIMYAQTLLVGVSKDQSLIQNSEIIESASKLQECLMLPATIQNLMILEHSIQKLRQIIERQKQEMEREGVSSNYTKVKKSGNAYIPVEEEHKNIEVPIYQPMEQRRDSLRQVPDYIYGDKVIPVYNITPANRGSSHVLMLAFLSFFFESLFLVLSFLLYKG